MKFKIILFILLCSLVVRASDRDYKKNIDLWYDVVNVSLHNNYTETGYDVNSTISDFKYIFQHPEELENIKYYINNPIDKWKFQYNFIYKFLLIPEVRMHPGFLYAILKSALELKVTTTIFEKDMIQRLLNLNTIEALATVYKWDYNRYLPIPIVQYLTISQEDKDKYLQLYHKDFRNRIDKFLFVHNRYVSNYAEQYTHEDIDEFFKEWLERIVKKPNYLLTSLPKNITSDVKDFIIYITENHILVKHQLSEINMIKFRMLKEQRRNNSILILNCEDIL